MKLLFVASECAPFIKTGGLADVIGAVPKALTALGGDVRVLIPAYPALKAQVAAGDVVMKFDNLFGGAAQVVSVSSEGINLLLLEAPHLFDRAGNIYLDQHGNDWGDNHLRFGALSYVGARIAAGDMKQFVPDLVNAHDWQAGLVSAFLRTIGKANPPVVMTIHNIAFQGLFDASCVEQLGLPRDLFHADGLEYYGKLSFLKAGLALADKISTVSPTYARELMSPEFGMGMEGLLNARRADLTGILNGIDLDIWNPEIDEALVGNYSAKSPANKAANKSKILEQFNLHPDLDAPLFCVVSRLTTQKGLDLLLEALPSMIASGARLAVLGTGDRGFERAFVDASNRYPGSVGTIIGYDEKLSHLLQAGSDAILIPSRFEPCGLTQLYGLRYGTIPVVARTGGLADTIIDANEAAMVAGCATGLQFSPITTLALEQAIARTCRLYAEKTSWTAMVRRAMNHPVGWDSSANAYMALYQSLIDRDGATGK